MPLHKFACPETASPSLLPRVELKPFLPTDLQPGYIFIIFIHRFHQFHQYYHDNTEISHRFEYIEIGKLTFLPSVPNRELPAAPRRGSTRHNLRLPTKHNLRLPAKDALPHCGTAIPTTPTTYRHDSAGQDTTSEEHFRKKAKEEKRNYCNTSGIACSSSGCIVSSPMVGGTGVTLVAVLVVEVSESVAHAA